MTTYDESTLGIHPEDPRVCALVEDLLPLYLEGEVNPGSRAMIVQHLSECQHCAGFLAGAQSARAQLRTEQRHKQAVLNQDQLARQTLSAGQRLLALINLLVGYGMIVAATGVFLEAVSGGDFLSPGTFIALAISGVLGLGGLGIMALVTRSSGPITAMRIIGLLPFFLVAGLGSLMIPESPVGLFLWIFGFIGVWLIAAPPSMAQAEPQPGSTTPTMGLLNIASPNLVRQIGGIALLCAGGIGILFITGASLRYVFNPLSAVLLIVVGLLLWQRRQQQGE